LRYTVSASWSSSVDRYVFVAKPLSLKHSSDAPSVCEISGLVLPLECPNPSGRLLRRTWQACRIEPSTHGLATEVENDEFPIRPCPHRGRSSTTPQRSCDLHLRNHSSARAAGGLHRPGSGKGSDRVRHCH